ncbi:hypothetical protein TI39_contig491g00001 [Zymoseptoria brevis]|uniref:Uncharacterized protein n=1 Tax=Zymoseptoria brevis TaxID=1047168 RepID=A0A0F4GK48_9PEZI|nr:hypothetical protein TI39_contig491g00001 [Zymoseptoria brevis]
MANTFMFAGVVAGLLGSACGLPQVAPVGTSSEFDTTTSTSASSTSEALVLSILPEISIPAEPSSAVLTDSPIPLPSPISVELDPTPPAVTSVDVTSISGATPTISVSSSALLSVSLPEDLSISLPVTTEATLPSLITLTIPTTVAVTDIEAILSLATLPANLDLPGLSEILASITGLLGGGPQETAVPSAGIPETDLPQTSLPVVALPLPSLALPSIALSTRVSSLDVTTPTALSVVNLPSVPLPTDISLPAAPSLTLASTQLSSPATPLTTSPARNNIFDNIGNAALQSIGAELAAIFSIFASAATGVPFLPTQTASLILPPISVSAIAPVVPSLTILPTLNGSSVVLSLPTLSAPSPATLLPDNDEESPLEAILSLIGAGLTGLLPPPTALPTTLLISASLALTSAPSAAAPTLPPTGLFPNGTIPSLTLTPLPSLSLATDQVIPTNLENFPSVDLGELPSSTTSLPSGPSPSSIVLQTTTTLPIPLNLSTVLLALNTSILFSSSISPSSLASATNLLSLFPLFSFLSIPPFESLGSLSNLAAVEVEVQGVQEWDVAVVLDALNRAGLTAGGDGLEDLRSVLAVVVGLVGRVLDLEKAVAVLVLVLAGAGSA